MDKNAVKKMLDDFRQKVDTTVFDSRREVTKEAVYTDINGFMMNWSMTNCGFGQFYFAYDDDLEKAVIDTETMGPANVLAMLSHLAKNAVYSDFEKIVKIPVEMSFDTALENFDDERFNPYSINYSKDATMGVLTKKIDQKPLEDEECRVLVINFQLKNQLIEKNEELYGQNVSLKEFLKSVVQDTDVEVYYKVVKIKENYRDE